MGGGIIDSGFGIIHFESYLLKNEVDAGRMSTVMKGVRGHAQRPMGGGDLELTRFLLALSTPKINP